MDPTYLPCSDLCFVCTYVGFNYGIHKFLQSVSRVRTYKNNMLAFFQIMMRTQRWLHLTVMRTQSLKQVLFMICFPIFVG